MDLLSVFLELLITVCLVCEALTTRTHVFRVTRESQEGSASKNTEFHFHKCKFVFSLGCSRSETQTHCSENMSSLVVTGKVCQLWVIGRRGR